MPSTPSPMPRGLLVLLTAAGVVVTVAGLRAASGIVACSSGC